MRDVDGRDGTWTDWTGRYVDRRDGTPRGRRGRNGTWEILHADNFQFAPGSQSGPTEYIGCPPPKVLSLPGLFTQPLPRVWGRPNIFQQALPNVSGLPSLFRQTLLGVCYFPSIFQQPPSEGVGASRPLWAVALFHQGQTPTLPTKQSQAPTLSYLYSDQTLKSKPRRLFGGTQRLLLFTKTELRDVSLVEAAP